VEEVGSKDGLVGIVQDDFFFFFLFFLLGFTSGSCLFSITGEEGEEDGRLVRSDDEGDCEVIGDERSAGGLARSVDEEDNSKVRGVCEAVVEGEGRVGEIVGGKGDEGLCSFVLFSRTVAELLSAIALVHVVLCSLRRVDATVEGGSSREEEEAEADSSEEEDKECSGSDSSAC